MATVDFDAFDADNHYYEATDAFTRHLPAAARQARAMGGDRRQAADDRRQQDLPLHPEPHLRPGGPAGLPRRLLPGQGRGRRHPRGVRRARADQSRLPRSGGAHGAHGRAAPRRMLLVPDARGRCGGGAAPRSRRAARRVPRLQPMDARRLDVQLPRADLRGAVHLPAGSRLGRRPRSSTRSRRAPRSS